MNQLLKLPIDEHIPEIINKTCLSIPLILTASPGSGKTTRFPAQLLLKLRELNNQKKIIVIVPKRVSAISAAARIAEENNLQLGQDVGYQVRFENKTTSQTQLIFMTEGVFLKRIQSQNLVSNKNSNNNLNNNSNINSNNITKNFWSEIHTLILDEFHERSSSLDLILGLAYEKFLDLSESKTSFNFVIMSATLNVNSLQSYFLESNHIDIKGQVFPLEVFYLEKAQRLICDEIFYQTLKETLFKAIKTSKKDILIFLPGKHEIFQFKKTIDTFLNQNSTLFQIEVLHGSLTLAEQRRIVSNKSSIQTSIRRIILSTNIAESSITLSGVDTVIDSGLEKKIFREDKLSFTGLDLSRISLFSSKQRGGRAAREQKGFYYKMWHETDERSMPEQIEPEIISSQLIDESLLLISYYTQESNHQIELSDENKIDVFKNKIASFLWLTAPQINKINLAIEKLNRWSLLTDMTKRKLIASWPLKIENALIHYEFTNTETFANSMFIDYSARLLAYLESDALENILKSYNKLTHAHELDFLLETSSQVGSYQQIYQQILNLTGKISTHTNETISFHEALIQIFVKYFPERVAQKKQNSTFTSLNGRGLAVPLQSSLTNNDFFIILAARENHSASTQVQLGLAFNKKIAYSLFEPQAQLEKIISYDFEQNKFFASEKLVFQSLVLKDFGKNALTENEIKKNWKHFLKNESEQFLMIHNSYSKLISKINFINKKNDIFNIKIDLNEFRLNLVETIINFYQDFEDFLNADLIYLTYESLSDELSQVIQNLPDSVTSPRGKLLPIDYDDEKAPMISLKLQEAFGWKDTPKIYYNKISLTLQLLAPNMRPTQITNQLAYFWKNSYHDVRKELKARYPKHDWPENPGE